MMDEKNYRSTYHDLNGLPCAFEKAILQQCCSCHRARHFNLAERIGVACSTENAQKQCQKFLALMHSKSVFALQLPKYKNGQLPHAKEIKIQCGGVNGLHQLKNTEQAEKDVDLLLSEAIQQCTRAEDLPYEQIVRSVVKFEGRKRRNQK